MFRSFIFLLPCLLVVLPTSHGKPVQVDNIKRLIRVAIIKIQNELREYNISPQVSLDRLPEVIPGNKPIQGLSSVIHVLTGFERMLDSMWGANSVFRMNLGKDFSTLQGHLERKCPGRNPSSFGDLDAYLKENQQYTLSLVPKFLQRFNDYMNLCLSIDTNVETC